MMASADSRSVNLIAQINDGLKNSFHIHPFQRHTYIGLTSGFLLLMWQTNKKVCLPMSDCMRTFYAALPCGRRIGNRMRSIEWCHLQ